MTTEEPLRATPAHNLVNRAFENAHISAPYEVPRGPVTSTLRFYKAPEDGSKPYNYVETPPEGQPRSNYGSEGHEVEIKDIRGRESQFTLDNNAFQAISNISSHEKDFTDDEQIKRVYYPEVERLLLEHVPGANRVVFFDHTVRRSTPNAERGPVNYAHIDQTAKAAAERVRIHVPEEAETLLQGRYRIINVWRPLNGPVYSSPLAFADGSSVKDEDVIPADLIYPTRRGETAAIKHNPGQKWYYWSGMTNDERVLLKCFDSEETVGPHGRVPHSAFVDPRTPPNAPGRESVEVRTLVFG